MLWPAWVIIKMSNVMRVIIKGFTVHTKSISALCKYKLLGAFDNLRKETIRFVKSVYL